MAAYSRTCPYCKNITAVQWQFADLSVPGREFWHVEYMTCPNPNCKSLVVDLIKYTKDGFGNPDPSSIVRYFVYPQFIVSEAIPSEVPESYVKDCIEAHQLLPISPRASAAMSRRLLQRILVEQGGFSGNDLKAQIDQARAAHLPSFITDPLHTIRVIGNYAVHPNKDKLSGEILDVEPGEAEALLEVFDVLFDFYFVRPERNRLSQEAANAKLVASGKSPLP